MRPRTKESGSLLVLAVAHPTAPLGREGAAALGWATGSYRSEAGLIVPRLDRVFAAHAKSAASEAGALAELRSAFRAADDSPLLVTYGGRRSILPHLVTRCVIANVEFAELHMAEYCGWTGERHVDVADLLTNGGVTAAPELDALAMRCGIVCQIARTPADAAALRALKTHAIWVRVLRHAARLAAPDLAWTVAAADERAFPVSFAEDPKPWLRRARRRRAR